MFARKRGVSFGDLADHPDRRLRRQPEPLPQLGVEALLRVMLAKYSIGMHLRRQPRRRVIASAQRGVQGRSLEPRVGSTRTLTTCFTSSTVTAGTDRSLLRLAMNGQAFDKGGRREIGGYRR